MSEWNVKFSPDAAQDYRHLDGSQRILVDKALKKVSQNPLSTKEGGYGKPLSNYSDSELAGYYKIKLKSSGIRIVYRLIRIDGVMYIVIIGMRETVYKEAERRIR